MGITDLSKKYTENQMAKGDVLFIASGVTDGKMLEGVRKERGHIYVNSLIMDSSNKSMNPSRQLAPGKARKLAR